MTVLHWIRADARQFKPFVAHRVGEIRDSTEPRKWRWVPTQHNVADEASRGISMNELCTGRWKAGPEFLALPPENWPVAADMREIPEDTVYELKNAFVATVTTPPNVLPDVCRFSNWKRLICATAYVLRFIGNLRARVQGAPARDEPAITAEEQEGAERLVVKTVC